MITRRGLVGAAAAVAALAAAPPAGAQTTICHATGQPDAPYQKIDVSPEASFEHLQHADDIVPAPPEGCPLVMVAEEVDPPSPYPLPTATVIPDVVPPPQARSRPRRRRAAPRAQVAPAISSGNLRATATVEPGTLPMTGAEIPTIALVGLGFLLTGAGLRLRLRT